MHIKVYKRNKTFTLLIKPSLCLSNIHEGETHREYDAPSDYIIKGTIFILMLHYT